MLRRHVQIMEEHINDEIDFDEYDIKIAESQRTWTTERHCVKIKENKSGKYGEDQRIEQ